MQLSGMIRTTCPPDRLTSLLHDPVALTAMMPGGAEIKQTSPTSYTFRIQKSFGPLKLSLPGTMTVTPSDDGNEQHLVAHASHLIGGKVDVDLAIKLSTLTGVTVLNYAGSLTSSGLAHRVIGENETRAQTGLRAVFLRLKQHAEGGKRSPAKAQGKAPGKAAKKA